MYSNFKSVELEMALDKTKKSFKKLRKENQDLKNVLSMIVNTWDSGREIELSDIDDAKKLLGIEE